MEYRSPTSGGRSLSPIPSRSNQCNSINHRADKGHSNNVDPPSMYDHTREQPNDEDSGSPSSRSFLDRHDLLSSCKSSDDDSEGEESSVDSMPSTLMRWRQAMNGEDERIASIESESSDGEEKLSVDDGNDSSSSSDSSMPALVNQDGVDDSSSTDSEMPALVRREDDDDDESASSMPRLIGRDGREYSSGDEWDTDSQYSWTLKITSFPQLKELSDDLVIAILSWVADCPFEIDSNSRSRTRPATSHQSTLTHVLPLVSKHFRSLCQRGVNYFWKEGLERLVVDEPMMWKEGVLRLLPDSHEIPSETPRELVERAFATLGLEDYRQLFQWVVQRYLRFTAPVFYMPGFVRIGRPIGVHLFEPRYRRLIAEILEPFPESARRGEDIVALEDGSLPMFIYAHSSPLRAGSAACLVQVLHCLLHEDETADVSLLPRAFVRLERVWEVPDSGALNKAVAFRMGREASNREGRMHTPEIDLLEMMAEGGINDGPHFGIRGTINAILAFLAARGDEGLAELNIPIHDDDDESIYGDDDSFPDDDESEEDNEDLSDDDDSLPMLLGRNID